MVQDRTELQFERRASLRAFNSFGLPAVAAALVRLRSEADSQACRRPPEFGPAKKLILAAAATLGADTRRGRAWC
jgi:UDP-N-acetylmuramate dehydrogenase